MFRAILEMSITGSVVALVVMLARLFLKKAPAKYSFLLWSIVALRLICPFSFSSAMSIFNVVPEPQIYVDETSTHSPVTLTNENILYIKLPEIRDTTAEIVPQNNFPDIEMILFSIWLLGTLSVIAVNIISCIRLNKKLAFATHSRDNIYHSDKIDAPFVFGIFSPKIYLPEGIAKENEDYIIAHERMHIKRLDFITKPIGAFIVALHWFNPIVWLSFRLFENDMERACDEKAVASFDKDIRKEYAETLLDISLKQNSGFFSAPLSFGEKSVKSRIKNVLKNKKKTVFMTVISVIIVTMLVGCLATSAEKDGSLKNYSPTDEPAQTSVTESYPSTIPENHPTTTAPESYPYNPQTTVTQSAPYTSFESVEDICEKYIADYYTGVFKNKDFFNPNKYYYDEDMKTASLLTLDWDAKAYSPDSPTDFFFYVKDRKIEKKTEGDITYLKIPYEIGYGEKYSSGFGTIAYFVVEKVGDDYRIKRAILATPADMCCGFDAKDIDSAELPFIRANTYPIVVYVNLSPKTFSVELQPQNAENIYVQFTVPDQKGYYIENTDKDRYNIRSTFKGELIGEISCESFEPYTGTDVPKGEYYKTVYPSLRLSSIESWTADYYKVVAGDDNFESALCDVIAKDFTKADDYEGRLAELPTTEFDGILSYNKEQEVFVKIKFEKGYFTEEELEKIAQSIIISR